MPAAHDEALEGFEFIEPEWPAPPSVRAGSTTRRGGASHPPYDHLNLALRVGDDPDAVAENRKRLGKWLHLPSEPLWMRQVHGTRVIEGGTRGAGYRGGRLRCALVRPALRDLERGLPADSALRPGRENGGRGARGLARARRRRHREHGRGNAGAGPGGHRVARPRHRRGRLRGRPGGARRLCTTTSRGCGRIRPDEAGTLDGGSRKARAGAAHALRGCRGAWGQPVHPFRPGAFLLVSARRDNRTLRDPDLDRSTGVSAARPAGPRLESECPALMFSGSMNSRLPRCAWTG